MAQAEHPYLEQRFEGELEREALCSFLVTARHSAESQGRLDSSAAIQSFGAQTSRAFIARLSTGSAYAVRQIDFSGHRKINDSTLRRALAIFEHDMLDVRRLRHGLAQINRLGIFEPLTLEDVTVTRLDDHASVDLTIPLRERKARWWSISGLLLPGANPLHASVASRLPAWGRGILETATYFVSLNVMVARQLLAIYG